RSRAAEAPATLRREWPIGGYVGSRRSSLIGENGQPGSERQDQSTDPQPGHHAVDLDLDRRVRAVFRVVPQDEVEVLHESEAIIHAGDRRLLLRIEFLGRMQ